MDERVDDELAVEREAWQGVEEAESEREGQEVSKKPYYPIAPECLTCMT